MNVKENNNKLDNMTIYENKIGVATELICNCKQHKLLFVSERDRTKFVQEKNHTRSESLLLNNKLVLYFQSLVGCGCEED